MNKLMKLTAVLIACLASWLITSRIIAQQPAKRRVANVAPAAPAATKVRSDGNVAVMTRAEAAKLLGMSELRSFQVNVAEGKATVALDSIVVDHRRGISFVWRLRVIDAAKNPLIDVWYNNQVFQVEADGAIEPKFREVFDLPAGAARVSVMLYELPPGTDLEAFKQRDPEERNSLIVFRGNSPVNP